jgi:hypothetical protein
MGLIVERTGLDSDLQGSAQRRLLFILGDASDVFIDSIPLQPAAPPMHLYATYGIA